MNKKVVDGLTRRHFMVLAGAAAAVSATGIPAFAQSDTLKFWDMPWGEANYGNAVKALTASYVPADGLPAASHQQIQWSNFFQTFSSALASDTGPAVSTGGAFQAFQFSEQGQIAYADAVIEKFRADGTIDDFLPGVVDALKTPAGYVGVPWQMDMRVIWYRKSLLEKAGVEPPTDWASWMEVGKALKEIGVYAFGTGAGPNSNIANQALIALMINNGGGLFDENGRPDALFDRNVEAMEFVREMAVEGLIDPASVAYTSDNITSMWKAGRFGIGFHTPGLDVRLGDTDGDIVVMSPPAGPHGDKGSLFFVNNLMMYKHNPSQEGTEAFVEWYVKNMRTLWEQRVVPQLPVLKSIVNLPELQQDPQTAKIINEWQPISKPQSARSSASFGAMASVDGAQMLFQFTQTMLAGRTPAKEALATLQSALESVVS